MSDDLEFRLLRGFVAVADELHFGRAAQRLYVAQQALSRDIRRLEDRVGVRLFDRTTRQVTLTSPGRRLLVRARELLELHDATLRELRGTPKSLTVDIVGTDLTPAPILARAREIAPGLEFFARFHTGTEPALPLLSTGRLDVTFGRAPTSPGGVLQRAVRYEPLAVLLPAGHRLAELDAVPLPSLRGDDRPCFRSGDHATPGWEHAVRQLLTADQTYPTDGHPHVPGTELAQHISDRGNPILTVSTQPPVAGAVLRPLTEPTPLFPWSMIWRADLAHPGLDALLRAAAELTAANAWLDVPGGAWLPAPEADATAPG